MVPHGAGQAANVPQGGNKAANPTLNPSAAGGPTHILYEGLRHQRVNKIWRDYMPPGTLSPAAYLTMN